MRWIVLTLLLASGAGTAARAAPEPQPETYRGKRVVLKAPPLAPFLGGRPGQRVDRELVLGTVGFPVVHADKHLLVAMQPGAKATRKVTSGRILKLTWQHAEKEQQRSLHLSAGLNGLWRFAVLDAWQFKLAGVAVTLVDANGDGDYDDVHEDGVLVGGFVHLLPLRDALVLGRKLVRFERIAPSGSEVRATVTPIVGSKAQLAALDLLNALRLQSGLSPVQLEPQHCKGCTEHAEYLAAMGWNGNFGAVDPHVQDPTQRKATPDGARVAGASIIMKSTAVEALKTHYLTYFHRVGMLHPRLRGVGINETVPSIAVMDVFHGRAEGDVGARMHAVPRFCPANGAVEVPKGAHSEFPEEPVENLARRGWPLMVWFPEAGGEITAFSGELTLLKRGRREVPVLIAKPGSQGVAGLVPARPLASNASYEAVFRWKRGGRTPVVHKIRFRTR